MGDEYAPAPGAFTVELWSGIEDTYQAILDHPFVAGLTDGSLERESFSFYIVQDARYHAGRADLPRLYLVWADEPHRHYQLSAPAPPAGAPAAELSKSACWPSRRRARRSRPSLREATTVVRRADSSPDAGQRPVPPGATLRATVTAKEELRRAIEELSEASTRSIASPTIHRGKT